MSYGCVPPLFCQREASWLFSCRRNNQIFMKQGSTITLYDLRHFYHTFAITQSKFEMGNSIKWNYIGIHPPHSSIKRIKEKASNPLKSSTVHLTAALI